MANNGLPMLDQRPAPQPLIDARVAGLVAAINSNNRGFLLDFLHANMALSSSSRETVAEYVDWLASFSRVSGGIVLREVRPAQAHDFIQTAVVEDRTYSAAHAFHLRMEARADGKILEIAGGPSEMESVPMSQADCLANVQNLCEQGARADVFSGAVLVARDSEVMFEYVCGAANKRYNALNNLDTKFNLGSANKMFTAVAVAQLADRGRLSFTDTIDRYIDETWLPASVTRGITVHHLLSHTSGLGSFFNETFVNGSRARFRAIDDFKALVRDDRPAFPPGERFEYSNTGMLLAGVVIERVTGMSYYDYIRDAIYEPSGMRDTDCYDIDAPVPNLAMGYIRMSN